MRLLGARAANTGNDASRVPMFKPSYLVKGFPGHPLHPPLTDATIGAYTAATVLGILAYAGVSEENLTKAWWLALLVGLGSTALTASTGLADWLGITRGTRSGGPPPGTWSRC
jgi:hypothetical protein